MRNLLLVAVFLFATKSMASMTSVQAGVGMVNGIFNLNLDFDFQKKRSHSFGGYLVYGAGEEGGEAFDATRGQFWSVGGDLKVFMGPKGWKVYFSPGIGIVSYESPGGELSETTVGTVFRGGALVRISPTMYVGLEQMFIQSWFSTKAYGGYYLLTNIALRMNFR